MLSEKDSPFLAYGVYITEIVAPLLIVVGYRTRLAAAVFIFGIYLLFLGTQQNYFIKR
jgi:putative oxidoreductase